MTLVELLVASVVTTAVMAGVLAALGPAQAMFVAESDGADARQRLRVVVDTLTRELLPATAAAPFQHGGRSGDAIAITEGPEQYIYYLGAAGDLRRSDAASDFPVVDGLADLSFAAVNGSVRVMVAVVDGRGRLEAAFDVAPRNAGDAR